MGKKNYKKAIEYYQKAFELKPEFTEARNNLEKAKETLKHNMIKKRN